MNAALPTGRTALVVALVLVLTGCGFMAPQRNAGYADIDRLSWRDVDTTMNLSIGPTLLRFAANMIEDDPQTRELLRSLDGVRIKIYRIEGDAFNVATDLDQASRELATQGWEPIDWEVDEDNDYLY